MIQEYLILEFSISISNFYSINLVNSIRLMKINSLISSINYHFTSLEECEPNNQRKSWILIRPQKALIVKCVKIFFVFYKESLLICLKIPFFTCVIVEELSVKPKFLSEPFKYYYLIPTYFFQVFSSLQVLH